MTGQIEVITGCMFSGKTEELIKRLNRAQLAKKLVLAFKPKNESRYSVEHIVSNSGMEFPCTVIDADKSENILEIIKNNKVDVVAIDESNFFSDKIVDVCERLAKSNIDVIITGMDMNFRGEPFPPIPDLM